MALLLIGGIAAFTIGIFALGYGIPIKEFSFGNTLIIAGAVIASAGMLLLGLWVVCRELRAVAARLGVTAGELPPLPRAREAMPPAPTVSPEPPPVVIGDLLAAPAPEPPEAAPVWPEPPSESAVPEPPPAPKPKRNLLFSSSSRKERERAAAKAAQDAAATAVTAETANSEIAAAPPPAPEIAPPVPDLDPRASFEAAWPQAERTLPGSSGRLSAADESKPPPPRVRPAPKPVASEVTILKSGVVDGMAYSLYSDGSIEAQMPEGMVRFASIEELRAHLDQKT